MTPLTPRSALLLAFVLSTMLVVALYWAAVRTETGQRLDHHIYETRKAEPLALRKDATALLNTIGSVTLPMLTAAVVLLALSVGGWRRALGVGAVVTGAVLSSELLKRGLSRPGLIDIDLHLLTHNSFPSGHATIAMAIGLALIMAAPTRMRTLLAMLAVLMAGAFGVATMVGGWHRPSDTLAGYLVALAWACLIAWLLQGRGGGGVSAADPGIAAGMVRGFQWSVVAVLLSWLGLVVMLVLEFEFGGSQLLVHDELLVAAAVIVSSALFIVWWWLRRQTSNRGAGR